MLTHNVFFALKDNSADAIAAQVASCRKYLSEHPGTAFFAVGTAADLDREVNDRDFDVALHVIFESREAHDVYQKADRHLAFIAENKENWKKVRVFDSNC
jgi:heme-degrading monooxygenase HmoA